MYDIPAEDASLHDICDINLELTNKGYWERFKTVKRFVTESLDKYDIYHFHSARTFIPFMAYSRWSFLPNWLGRYFDFLDMLDLPYLKSKGKKIVFQFWGCDIRSPAYEKQYPEAMCFVCDPEIQRIHCDKKLKAKILHFIRKYGDATLATGDLVACYNDFQWVRNAIDTSYWKPVDYEMIPEKFRLKQDGAVKIYHSFSKSDLRGDIKGTKAVMQAIEELKKEGHNAELMFFNYVPHDDIRYYQTQADIVVDQLKAGIYGNTGVECLSMGKPTICYFREEVDKMMTPACPVVRANTTTVKEELRRLIVDEQYRINVGEQSRQYAVKHHDVNVVGRKLEQVYYRL